ncbi:hypothetical protein NW768_010130 [Fusarium equiseti]|uniref:Uncharacterized protein n=1 Tax=Fusarium equiseti TaxID=61235 RepID=A0ABQ8R0Q8_FUSEQ|nr:hypothetical protein NW768_010130 [Fusarium equiseti]
MSSSSDYEQVSVLGAEEIVPAFTRDEKAQLYLGKRNEAINNKLGVMSFRQFEYELNFVYFQHFLQTIPECVAGSARYRFAYMKRFVLRERMMSEPVQIEITPEGYIFYGDNLIAL